MCIGWLDLGKLLEKLAGIELSIVLLPQTLDGRVDALGVGSTEKVCLFSSPIHGLFLDLNHLRLICRYHMIHGPDVATWLIVTVSPELIW